MSDDLMERLHDLHKQATVERSHYYVGKCVADAIHRIEELEAEKMTNTTLFLGLAKVSTFRRDRDALRSAIYESGDETVLEAWRNFERWTDCINPNPAEQEKNDE